MNNKNTKIRLCDFAKYLYTIWTDLHRNRAVYQLDTKNKDKAELFRLQAKTVKEIGEVFGDMFEKELIGKNNEDTNK